MNPEKPNDRSEEDKLIPKRSAEEEAMPTADIPAEFLTSSYLATNELHLLSFYLPGRSNPIIINGSKTITIGRRDPKRRVNPTLDLTEDNGAKLGVSRLHAEIAYVSGRYYIKDLNSANGTWVNEAKLTGEQPFPIDSGDQIRLGQLAIVVHISMPQRRVSHDVISTMIDEVMSLEKQTYKVFSRDGRSLIGNSGGILPDTLTLLNSYLQHTAAIYSIFRKAQQSPDIGLAVVAIRARTEDKSLVIDVAEGDDIVTFLADKMPSFIKVIEGTAKGTRKQTDSLQRYPDRFEQIADYALQELVFRFLHEQRDDFVAQLAPHFRALNETGLLFAVSQS